MAQTCPACDAENADQASFCRECGNALGAPADIIAERETCPACGAEISPHAAFCGSCGAAAGTTSVRNPRRFSPRAIAIAAAAAAVILVAGIGSFLAFSSGGDDKQAGSDEPSPTAVRPLDLVSVDPAVVERLEEIIADMPEPSGQTDREQFRSLLGPPEAFTIAIEVDDQGISRRREEWFYYDLRSVYEFVDGTLVANLPIEAEHQFLILPIQYDPDSFEMGSTWEEVAASLGGAERFESFQLEPAYELEATVYVGDLLRERALGTAQRWRAGTRGATGGASDRIQPAAKRPRGC